MTDSEPEEFILTLSCLDVRGIVHAVTGFLVEHQFTITESQQFGDQETERFFMRVRFTRTASIDVDQLRTDFLAVADRFDMTWQMRGAGSRYRVLVMVSRFGHCLNDLLFRQSTGSLNLEISAVVSNHRDFEGLANAFGVPYHYIPVGTDAADKANAEARLTELIDRERIDLVVLARYMQILSNDLCRRLEGRAMNIHHSFLPSFKGARPYHQAHERGVKLIGATAHYVTADLDEGPIIEQEVIRVDHAVDTAGLAAAGRDAECQALSRAVKWHTESRILLNGRRTVVFD